MILQCYHLLPNNLQKEQSKRKQTCKYLPTFLENGSSRPLLSSSRRRSLSSISISLWRFFFSSSSSFLTRSWYSRCSCSRFSRSMRSFSSRSAVRKINRMYYQNKFRYFAVSTEGLQNTISPLWLPKKKSKQAFHRMRLTIESVFWKYPNSKAIGKEILIHPLTWHPEQQLLARKKENVPIHVHLFDVQTANVPAKISVTTSNMVEDPFLRKGQTKKIS